MHHGKVDTNDDMFSLWQLVYLLILVMAQFWDISVPVDTALKIIGIALWVPVQVQPPNTMPRLNLKAFSVAYMYLNL